MSAILMRRTCEMQAERVGVSVDGPDGAAAEPVDMDALCAKINALKPAPIVRVTPADVMIFSALVANDQVDSYSTRFSRAALAQVTDGIIGVPVLRNHGTWSAQDLPVGRWFDSDVVVRDGVTWSRAWQYMSAAPEAMTSRELTNAINLAIIREVSLSWWQDLMRCSICNQDMWATDDEGRYLCTHVPGQTYNGVTCVGEMESIKEVAEASLVWKGGQYGTQLGEAGARSEVEDRSNEQLVQRIAAKRSTMPALAGESELDRYLGAMVRTPSAFENWYNAGANAAQEG